MHVSEIINELGEERDRYYDAIAPPIIQTSNFAFHRVQELREALTDEYEANLYSRGNNPTVTMLRKKLAALDGAEDALVLSSGVAAVFLAVTAHIRQGDHILCVSKPYSWTDRLLNKYLPRFGVATTMVDGTVTANFESALQRNTRLIFLESPNSFTFEIQDIKAVVKLAKKHGLITVIDNSYCSPLYQKPVEMGIDLSVQTATKYIGGHSDVVAGVIAGSRKMISGIFRSDLLTVGSIISPVNAWLLLRSLRTLPLRLERIVASTETITEWIETQPHVQKLYYPFARSSAQYMLAREQMKKAPGLFTVLLDASTPLEIERFCESLQHFRMAVSWGGHESLVFPSCAAISREEFDTNNINHRLVRFYIGLEDPEYLKDDIRKALEKI